MFGVLNEGPELLRKGLPVLISDILLPAKESFDLVQLGCQVLGYSVGLQIEPANCQNKIIIMQVRTWHSASSIRIHIEHSPLAIERYNKSNQCAAQYNLLAKIIPSKVYFMGAID